jgi:hypothetical protein
MRAGDDLRETPCDPVYGTCTRIPDDPFGSPFAKDLKGGPFAGGAGMAFADAWAGCSAYVGSCVTARVLEVDTNTAKILRPWRQTANGHG